MENLEKSGSGGDPEPRSAQGKPTLHQWSGEGEGDREHPPLEMWAETRAGP